MVPISTEEKYHELEISPFHVPFLRDLGIKVVSIIMFDIIYGPVCYLKELSRSNFGDKLKDVSSLSEIYTGFARTNADVITSLDERIVLGRFTTFHEEVENIVVFLSQQKNFLTKTYCYYIDTKAKDNKFRRFR